MDEIQKWTLEDELSDPCLDGNPRIWHHFSQCVRTPEQLVGFVFGCLALVFWLAAHLGVLRRRHKEGADEVRLDLPEAHHLLHEAGADVLNCLGAVLSHQLGTQILFGVYLLCMDALFMIQYFVFKTIRECTSRGHKSDNLKHEKDIKLKQHRVAVKLHTWPLLILLATSAGGIGLPLVTWHLTDHSEPRHGHHVGRVLLGHIEHHEKLPGTIRIGYVIGYLSILFHWTSLLPKAIKIFQDRRMSWSSLAITVLGIVGNLCYVTSVFCHYTDVGFLVHTLPWTLGRLGMIGIDSGLVMLSLVHYCRGSSLKAGQMETERLLGDGSEDESLSENSDWETPQDLKRNKKLLRMKANSKGLAVPKEHSDTDVSPQPSPALQRNRHKVKSKFTTSTLTSPSADPASDASAISGETEWKPAWTEEDVQVELTEEQVFAVLAEEDRKRELSGNGTESDSAKEAKVTMEVPEAGKTTEEAPVCWFDEANGALLNVDNEEVVDMQGESSATPLQ